jgi:hydrogenase nickel incorporation protein HypA/HybF
MHELSLVQALIDKVEQIQAREDGEEVLSVTVTIGALSGVARASFEFAFPLAAQGTALAKASLKIEETPAEVTCNDCAQVSHPDPGNVRCVQCGSHHIRITGGREMLIQAVELRMAS